MKIFGAQSFKTMRLANQRLNAFKHLKNEIFSGSKNFNWLISEFYSAIRSCVYSFNDSHERAGKESAKTVSTCVRWATFATAGRPNLL